MAESWTTIPLNDVSTTELVTAAQLNALGNNHRFLTQVEYAETTTSVLVDVTTAATSTLVVGGSARNYDAVLHCLEFGFPGVQRTDTGASNPSVFFGLYDNGAGTPVRTKLVRIQAPTTIALEVPVERKFYFTPTAASHTYQIRGYCNSADGFTVECSGSTGDNFGPAYMAIYRIPT